MTYAAPKAATLVDDFRTSGLNMLQWAATGTPLIYNNDSTTHLRGLAIQTSGRVSSVNTTSEKRIDLWDSEVVWIIGKWGTGATSTLSITHSNGQTGYRFELAADGTLLVKSTEVGITYTGANFLDGLGFVVDTFRSLKYMRIAHSAATGRVEFYAGNNVDGSDQRQMTSDLGEGSKGNLTPLQLSIDDMVISMSMASGGTDRLYVRAVNAPHGGLQRYPDDPSAYYIRDFNTWTGYGGGTNRFYLTDGSMSNEFVLLKHYGSAGVSVPDISLTDRVLRLQGDGGFTGRTALRTGFSDYIKNLSFEVNATILADPDNIGYLGMFWRASGSSQDRYQIRVHPGIAGASRVTLDVFINDSAWASSYGTSFITLASVSASVLVGKKYKFRVNHYEDHITVYQDDELILSATDLLSYIPTAGHVGFDVGTTNTGGAEQLTAVIHDVKVVSAYDEQSFGAGVSMQERGLGLFMETGRRDTSKQAMYQDPSMVATMESSLGVPIKTAYQVTASGPAPTQDAAIVAAAKQFAQQNRENVIVLNSIQSSVSDLTVMSVGNKAILDYWTTAINSIPGKVYLAVLPFPDLNTPWSPYSYDLQGTIAAFTTTTTTIQDTTGSWTTNQWAGYTLHFTSSSGAMYWTTVVSNTADQLTFSTVYNSLNQPFFNIVSPFVGSHFWLRSPINSLKHPTEYVTAYRAIVDYLRGAGCKASYVYAMNWAPDIAWRNSAIIMGAQGYPTVFDETYPGNSYVDAGLIRAVNLGLTTPASPIPAFRPLSGMLNGTYTDFTTQSEFSPAATTVPYTKMVAQNPNIPVLLTAGCAETHAEYNDLSSGFLGEVVTVANSSSDTNDEFAAVTTSAGNTATWWSPDEIASYNPRSSPLTQRGIRVNNTTSGQNVFRYGMPPSLVTRGSASCHFRVETIGTASSTAVIAQINATTTLLLGLRIDQTTGNMYALRIGETTGTLFGSAIQAGKWYRADLDWDGSTGTAAIKVFPILTPGDDNPGAATQGTYSNVGTPGTPNRVEFGTIAISAANCILNGVEIQEMKISWDTSASTYSKAKWMKDAVEMRGFANVRRLVLMSSDQASDVPLVSAVAATDPVRYATNLVDTRLDASKYTFASFKDALTAPAEDRIRSSPQFFPAEYSPSATVGQVEYMYLQDSGQVPLYLIPRIGGILLRDFNLGQASVRSSVEERPNADGVRDFSRWLSSKAVSLSLVTFDEDSGSAAFYADVLSSWASPRRRPTLIYKMKDGDERSINLRPDTTDAAWTIDGIRSGFKETQISFVGVDGKDFATTWGSTLLKNSATTDVVSNGTAATPPKIKIYGGTTGCTNPIIILKSEEHRTGSSSARISLGTANSTCFIPPRQFVEIDMDNRTVQLNGVPGDGSSYLRYLGDRQWFYLEPGLNAVYLETEDANGYASVEARDAFL